MKKVLYILALFLLAVTSSFAQQPVLKKTFSWTNGEEFAVSIARTEKGFYVAGAGTHGPSFGRVNDSLTAFDWVRYAPTGPVINVANSSGNASLWGYGQGISEYSQAGDSLWTTAFGGEYPRICAYGDSSIAVTMFNNIRVVVLDPNGVPQRQFPVMSTSRYIGGTKTIGNFLWIFGGDWGGVDANTGAFVRKYNILTGELLWAYHLPDHLPARGDVDENGNAYLGANLMTPTDPIAFHRFHVVKLDTAGNVVWSTLWYPHNNPLANIEQYTQGITVSPFSGGRQVILEGTAQKLDIPEHNGDKANYLAGLNAETGDTLWTRKWNNDSTEIIGQLYEGTFDSKGMLTVIGNSYLGISPNVCYVMQFYIPGVTLDVKEIPSGIPRTFALSQNYPNPFNPKTLIRFEIPSATDAKLTVYDVLGREVAMLLDKRVTPGTYEADWDASGMPSGMYFYRLQTATFTETKKMLLVK